MLIFLHCTQQTQRCGVADPSCGASEKHRSSVIALDSIGFHCESMLLYGERGVQTRKNLAECAALRVFFSLQATKLLVFYLQNDVFLRFRKMQLCCLSVQPKEHGWMPRRASRLLVEHSKRTLLAKLSPAAVPGIGDYKGALPVIFRMTCVMAGPKLNRIKLSG